MTIFHKLLGGVVGTSIAVYGYNQFSDDLFGSVEASWTTHHNTPEPAVKWDNDWDRRHWKPRSSDVIDGSGDSKEEGRKKPIATRHLLLIRHGQYVMDNQGDQYRLLTELGREQADMVGKRLKDYNIPITRLVWSTLTRATETGKIINKHFPDVPTENCDLLREGAPIPPEPPSSNWRPEMQFYQDGARIEAAFRKYFHRANENQTETSYEVLVCHANVIRYFVCRALQLPPEAWLRMSLHNGSITWITIRPNGRVSLRALGDSGYLPPDKLTTN